MTIRYEKIDAKKPSNSNEAAEKVLLVGGLGLNIALCYISLRCEIQMIDI